MTSIEAPARQWSVAHASRIVAAARSAPRWGVAHPWVLELRGRNVLVYESPPCGGRDRHAIDRWLACGAVLTNVRLAVRTSGRAVTANFGTDPDRLDLVAELTAGDTLPATVAETGQYAVINGGRPARHRHEVDALRTVMSASWCPGVELRPLRHGTGDLRGSREFVVVTVDDGRLDRVRAGAVVQSVSLAATAAGLTVYPAVNLLHVAEFRAGLIERLMLAGYPQVLLRIGLPPENGSIVDNRV